MSLDPTMLPETTITLRDGRQFGYVECGNPDGKPVFCFDGWPSSRWGALLKDAEAKKVGVRLIGTDRPGMGLSAFKRGRKLIDWPADVVALADTLGIEHWAVWGISGGAPFALVCAHQLPDRVAACGVVSGVGPIDLGTKDYPPAFRRQINLARRFPWLIRFMLWQTTGRHYLRDFETAQAAFYKGFEYAPEPDRALIDNPGNTLGIHMLREAFRQGIRGPAYEGRLLVQDWGFRLEEITLEHVYLWHGDLDTQTPPTVARATAERIPHCKATFFPDEAHSSAVVHHTEEMLRVLTHW
jgi:pimeloyl-ACP methyl ester carboxylesterase